MRTAASKLKWKGKSCSDDKRYKKVFINYLPPDWLRHVQYKRVVLRDLRARGKFHKLVKNAIIKRFLLWFFYPYLRLRAPMAFPSLIPVGLKNGKWIFYDSHMPKKKLFFSFLYSLSTESCMSKETGSRTPLSAIQR